MEERVSKLEDAVVQQQKTIENLMDIVDLLGKRVDLANKKIDLLKQLSEANVGMIKTNNDTLQMLFELVKKD